MSGSDLRRMVLLILVAPALGACAMTPAPAAPAHAAADRATSTSHAEALMTACANRADIYPWAMADTWDDGESYLPDMQFRADGVVAYAYGGNAFENGRWTLSGKAFHIDMNGHHVDYDGMFDGKTGAGAMKNVDGDTGEWTLRRACDG